MSFVLSLIAAAFYSISSALLSRTLKVCNAQGSGNAHWYVPGQPASNSQTQDHRTLPDETEITSRVARFHRLTLIFATAAVIIHGWIVINQTGLPDGLTLPLFTSLSASTLTIALLHIALCLRQPADYLGLAVYPLAAVTLIVSQTSGGGTPIQGTAVQIHVMLSFISYGVLALAAAQAALVATQRHFIAIHKPGGFVRALPPLDTTERLLFSLLSAGFVLLSLALLSGFIYLDNMFDQRVAHKTVLSCAAWMVFGILLFGRWQFGWRGKKAVHLTLGGFALLILAYFGTKTVIEFLVN